MSRCKQCKVNIKDNVTLCPLCKSVLERTEDVENMYPNIKIIEKKFNFLLRIYAFLAIVVETLLLYFNYQSFQGSHWSVVTGVVLFYLFIVMSLALKEENEYKSKSVILIVTAILSIILIDLLTGFSGWSLNYFLPGTIILLNTAVVIAMVFNARNWQSYMMIELLAIITSGIPFILVGMGLMTNMTLSLVASAFSIFLFLGTMIIGGGRASTELKRRFHVR